MPISKVHSSFGGNNKGSSSTLAKYLEKENIELEVIALNANDEDKANEIRNKKQAFFNHDRDDYSMIEAIENIDKNIQKLGKKDAKFFSPTINLSSEEQKHLTKLVTGRNIKSVDEMTPIEFKNYNKLIKEYTKEVMDNYASNFNREEKGLKDGSDLVYFAKVEHKRKYKGTDEEVKKGFAKNGNFKPGLQSHVHIIVSRKDKSQRLKLTPTTNERNKTRKIGNNVYRVGFDRKKWIQLNENTFDKMFEYERKPLEKVVNQNILKNGSPKEREQLLQSIKSKINKELEL